MLYGLEEAEIGIAHKGDSLTIAGGTCRTSDTVYVVLAVMRHVVIDHHTDIVDVDATCHNVGCHQHIHLSGLEAIHHIVAFLLGKVRVHRSTVDLHLLKGAVDILHLVFLATEDDNALQVALLEDVLDDSHLLRFVADIRHLMNLLGRTTHLELHLHGILQQ